MHVIPLSVRVLLSSVEFLITVFICCIYFSECSNYSLILMVIGNKAYSYSSIARFPIFITAFILLIDAIVIGRHIFGETFEYAVIVDYFGKGDDSIWTLLNYDFWILCLQFIKFFTIYNFTVLDICNHKPSIVKTVIEEYRQPDNDLQYISVMPNADSDEEDNNDDEIREVKVDQSSKKSVVEDKKQDTQSSNKNKKRQQHKYEVRRGFLGRFFKKGKDVGDFDNDENTLLINKDEESEIEYEEEEEEEEEIKGKNNSKSTLESSSRKNSIDNLLSRIDEALLSAESPSASPTANYISEYSSSLPPLIPTEVNNELPNTTSTSPPSDTLINLTSHPLINTEEEENENMSGEQASSSKNTKEKGKLPIQSNSIIQPNNNNNNKDKDKDKDKDKKKGKEAAMEEDEEEKREGEEEDEFYDAQEIHEFISNTTSTPKDEYPTTTNAIPLRHVNSTSSTSVPRSNIFYSQLNSNLYTSSSAGRDEYYYNNGIEAGTSSASVGAIVGTDTGISIDFGIGSNNSNTNDTNSPPIYTIDERERVTEGNENALLYLESYYEFVPEINIKVQEAIDTILAIRSSNRRNNTPEKREERRQILEVYEQTQRAQKFLKHLESLQRHQRASTSSLPNQTRNNLYQEPESDTEIAGFFSRSATQSPIPSRFPSRTQLQSQRRTGSTSTAAATTTNDNNQVNNTTAAATTTVSNQLRSYINGLHSSFRRSITGISPI